jgi:hypothetical protein
LIGGAESFKDKRRFFYKALQAHHSKNKTQGKNVTIEINRRNLLDSVSKIFGCITLYKTAAYGLVYGSYVNFSPLLYHRVSTYRALTSG